VALAAVSFLLPSKPLRIVGWSVAAGVGLWSLSRLAVTMSRLVAAPKIQGLGKIDL